MGKARRNRELRRRARDLFVADPAIARSLLNPNAHQTGRSLARKLRRTGTALR